MKKYNNKLKLRVCIVEILLGAAVMTANMVGLIADEFWASFGVVLIFIGALQLLRCVRYEKDADFRESFDIRNNDERNRYISLKAWAWTGYFYVMGGAVATIIFKLMGQEELMMFCSYGVCILMLLYWINYLYLHKKY